MNSTHKTRFGLFIGMICMLLLGHAALGWAAQITHTYDDNNRLIRTDYDNGSHIEYTYDAAGNRTGQAVVLSQPDLTNVALNKPASASDQYLPASNGNDGNLNTMWNGGKSTAWWMVDLQTTFTIDHVTVNGVGSPTNALDFTVQYSINGVDWISLGTGSFLPSSSASSKTFAAANAQMRFIKYLVTPVTAGSHDWAYLIELQAFGK